LDCSQVSSSGVVLYQHVVCNRDYGGATKAFSSPTDWIDIVSDFNDITSSIYVPSGWSIKVFEHSVAQGGGSWRCITGSMWDLRIDYYANGNTNLIINDTVSSIQVYNTENCDSLPTPQFVYPVDGQTLDYYGWYMFKVNPINDAQGFLWGFEQNGQLIWENLRDDGYLSGNEYNIPPGPIQAKFVPGPVKVIVRAYINNQWTNVNIIQIILDGSHPPALSLQSAGNYDGWILETSETSNKGGALNATATTFRLGDDAARKQYRSILSFTTSGLPDNAVITKVTLKFRQQGVVGGGNPVTTFQGFMTDIRGGIFGTSALQAADWQATAHKTLGPFTTAISGGWYTLDLTTARAYINKLATSGGLTQIRLRFKLDDNNNAVANYLSLYSGNAGAASRPQLIIEYYVP
jgi:hypothetical protein